MSSLPAGSLQLLAVVAHVSGAALASAHALLTKPDSRAAAGWIAVCCLFPLAGPILYWLFGINRIRRRARRLRPPAPQAKGAPAPGLDGSDARDMVRIGDALTPWPVVQDNGVEVLENGEQAFPAMLAAIRDARQSVWLATYIFETDALGHQFIDALAAAERRGVQVRVLVDGIGEWYSWPHAVPLLRRGGVKAARFLPPRMFPPRMLLNLRNHRKLLLVDGQICFVGGMNVGERRMADLHFRVDGGVVHQFAQVFCDDWLFAAGETLRRPEPRMAASPAAPITERSACRAITDGPDEDIDRLIFVILGAVAVARERIRIMTPYFVPPPELGAALQAAALRGIDVGIVVPERSNLAFVDSASRRCLTPLLEKGVSIYLQPAPFSHTKLLLIDDSYAQIGSANMDPRSLRLNFEVVMQLFDRAVCAQLAAYFDRAQMRSQRLSAEQLRQRSFAVQIRDSLCWLFSPYL